MAVKTDCKKKVNMTDNRLMWDPICVQDCFIAISYLERMFSFSIYDDE